MRQRLAAGVLCWAVLATVASTAQTPEDLQRPSGNKYTSVGCLSREGPAQTAPAAGRGAAVASPFIITDNRGETPTVYRLEGNQDDLAFYVGRMIQVEGPLSPPPANVSGPNAKAMILKVNSLVYLSPTCKFLK